MLICIDPCSALQVSGSPFLRSSAWTRSRHHPRREDYRLSLATPKILGRVCILWFIPDLFTPNSLSDLTSRNVWKACRVVAQYRHITHRTDLQRKLLLHIPKPFKRERGTQDRAIPNYEVNASWKCHLWIKKVCLFINQHTWPFY